MQCRQGCSLVMIGGGGEESHSAFSASLPTLLTTRAQVLQNPLGIRAGRIGPVLVGSLKCVRYLRDGDVGSPVMILQVR